MNTRISDAEMVEKLRAMMDHSAGGPGFVVYGTAQSINELERRLAPALPTTAKPEAVRLRDELRERAEQSGVSSLRALIDGQAVQS